LTDNGGEWEVEFNQLYKNYMALHTNIWHFNGLHVMAWQID